MAPQTSMNCDDSFDEFSACEHIRAELETYINELNFQELFGADQYLTTVNRTLVSTFAVRECPNRESHNLHCEMLFDPMAGSGQIMGYVDGERILWHDITWADFV